MNRVQITGWRDGLDKIGMTKAIRSRSGLDLAAAKSCTDAVLRGEAMIVTVPEPGDATALRDELNGPGAIAEIR
jgi:hypothetical protein